MFIAAPGMTTLLPSREKLVMNQLAPFGFADSHRLVAAVNYQMSRRWISPSNPTPIFSGDPVV